MAFLMDRLKAAYQATAFGVYGYRQFTQSAYLAHVAERHVPYLPADEDLSDKCILVTGANAGLGRVVAEELARRRARVTLLCRNAEAGERAAQEITQATGNPNVSCQRVDMSRPAEVCAFVQAWASGGAGGNGRAEARRVDVLINNAGVLLNERTMTPEGLEATFATNTLGPFLLTEGLLRHPGCSVGRVITVTSGGAYTARLEGEGVATWQGRSYDGPTVYAQSKRAEIALTQFWALRYPGTQFYSAHPGWADTPGVRTSLPAFRKYFRTALRTPEQGADTIVWAAVESRLPSWHPSGALLFDRTAAPVHLFDTGPANKNASGESIVGGEVSTPALSEVGDGVLGLLVEPVLEPLRLRFCDASPSSSDMA